MRARWIAVGAGALLLGIALVLVRGYPAVASDQGVYMSVAARLLDGDHLYRDVVEPKDPLFFYTYAAALWLGDWRGPFLLDGLWLALAGLSVGLLLRELRAPRAAVLAGALVYPLALTAGWYQPGLTMLAALAIAPLAAWLWLRGAFAGAGAVLGVVLLFKLPLAGVAVAPLAAFWLLGLPEGSRWRRLARAAAGLAAALAVAAVVLALRGELRGHLEMIAYNVHYASEYGAAEGPIDRARLHLDVLVDYLRLGARWALPAAILAVGAFAAAAALGWRRGGRERALAAAAAFTLAAVLVTLAQTAYWFHHLQMLALPAALMAATAIAVVARRVGERAGAVAAAACVVFALWSSLKHEDGLDFSLWRSEPHSGGAIALEEARARHYAGDERVTYMVFGSNSENGHAAFIGEEFDLSCRWFQLYPESLPEQLEETKECARREKPMLVLVTLGFFDDPPTTPEWASFVSSARALLREGYRVAGEEHPGFRAWARRPASS
jgi:hypothetical protein